MVVMATGLASVLAAHPAGAALVLIKDPSLAQAHTIQIFSDGVQSGDSDVFGHLQIKGVTGAGFRFSTPDGNLAARGGSGHLSVTGAFHQLLVAPTAADVAMTMLKFNFDVECCVAKEPDFFADVFADDVLVGTVSLRNASNPYLLLGNNGETFSTVRLVGWQDALRTIPANFRAISQFETVATEGAIVPVPEPATWITMIMGLGFIGRMLRHRKRAISVSLP